MDDFRALQVLAAAGTPHSLGMIALPVRKSLIDFPLPLVYTIFLYFGKCEARTINYRHNGSSSVSALLLILFTVALWMFRMNLGMRRGEIHSRDNEGAKSAEFEQTFYE